eukprot:855755-Prorocentrum_minimum.AAC.2
MMTLAGRAPAGESGPPRGHQPTQGADAPGRISRPAGTHLPVGLDTKHMAPVKNRWENWILECRGGLI